MLFVLTIVYIQKQAETRKHENCLLLPLKFAEKSFVDDKCSSVATIASDLLESRRNRRVAGKYNITPDR